MAERGRPRTSSRYFADHFTGANASDLFRDIRGKWPSSVGLTATFHNGPPRYCTARITTTLMPTGGQRPWFVCEFCNRRCAHLYLLDEEQADFGCRLCLRLAYSVQYRKTKEAAMVRLFRKWQEG